MFNKGKYMSLLLRKQAVFKMLHIDGIAKKTQIVYLLENTKLPILRYLWSTFTLETPQDKQVFNGRNWILDILQKRNGDLPTYINSGTGIFRPRQGISQEESAGTYALNLGKDTPSSYKPALHS